MDFVGGKLFLKKYDKVYIRIRGGDVVKLALLIFIIKIYEWHLILQTDYTEQELQLKL